METATFPWSPYFDTSLHWEQGVADKEGRAHLSIYRISLTWTSNILQARFSNKKVNTMAIKFIRQSRGDTDAPLQV